MTDDSLNLDYSEGKNNPYKLTVDGRFGEDQNVSTLENWACLYQHLDGEDEFLQEGH